MWPETPGPRLINDFANFSVSLGLTLRNDKRRTEILFCYKIEGQLFFVVEKKVDNFYFIKFFFCVKKKFFKQKFHDNSKKMSEKPNMKRWKLYNFYHFDAIFSSFCDDFHQNFVKKLCFFQLFHQNFMKKVVFLQLFDEKLTIFSSKSWKFYKIFMKKFYFYKIFHQKNVFWHHFFIIDDIKNRLWSAFKPCLWCFFGGQQSVVRFLLP